MKIEEIVKPFKEFLDENGIDYFVIEISNDLVPPTLSINEGKWVESGRKGYMQRLDAENPAIKQQRHVHVAKTKHINSKTMQVSWNEDGTKHDKHSFNSKIASVNAVQDIARDALGLPSNFKLEEAAKAKQLLLKINESSNSSSSPTPVLFTVAQT